MIVRRKVFVTQEDIDNGLIKNCYKCPVSLAIRRTFAEYNDYIRFSVKHTFVYDKNSERTLFKFPKKVTKFIRQFDDDSLGYYCDSKPFSFVMQFEE